MSRDRLIAEEVRALEGLGLSALRKEWGRRYGAPPQLRSPDLLARLLAWRIQSAALGGLPVELKRRLLRKAATYDAPALTPGMRLEREWRGQREVVDVVAGGFFWRGQTYGSLTSVALAMTGTKWNGPRFFGMRSAQP